MTCGYPEDTEPKVKTAEVIEFGIVEVNTRDLVVTRKESILVKPRYGHITPYCTELTGITQEMVDDGISFEKACKRIRNSYGSKSRAWYAWGDDARQVDAECAAKKCASPFGQKHVDLALLYCHLLGTKQKRGLYRALGERDIEASGEAHRAVDDAMNTALIWIDLAKSLRLDK